MSGTTTRVDKLLARVKNNPIVAAIIAIGIILVGLATFTDAMRTLLGVLPARNPLTTCGAGQWSSTVIQNPYSQDDRFRYTVQLEAIGDKLVGSLRQASAEGHYDINNPIADGAINGDQIYFIVHEIWVGGGNRDIPVIRSFRGSIIGKDIRFVETNNQGQPPREFVASCIDGDSPSIE